MRFFALNWRPGTLVSLSLLLGGPALALCQEGAAPVVVSAVLQRNEAEGQTFVGTLVPLQRSAVGSAVDGRVVEFPANEGDRVLKGDKLAQLLTETLNIELASAQAELTMRKQELMELENGARPEEIDQAKARMLAAKALMEYWQSKYGRIVALPDRRAVSEDVEQQTLSQFVETEQKYLENKASYALTLAGPRQEKIAQAKARVAIQTEVINRLIDQIKKHTIVAPFDGYIVAEHTEVGQWVSRGDLVAEVIALDQVDVQVFILEKHLPHVQKGMLARVEVPAAGSRTFPASVALVVPQADVRSRTFPAKIRLKNPTSDSGPLLKAGMLARVTLAVGEEKRVLLLSKDALVLGGPMPIVFVFDPAEAGAMHGVIRPVPVELGIATGNLIQVIGPLEEGQLVVVRGNERLRPGQQVRVTDVAD